MGMRGWLGLAAGVVLGALCLLAGGRALAQARVETPGSGGASGPTGPALTGTNLPPPTVEGVEADKESIRLRTDLEAGMQQQVLGHYTNALNWLAAGRKWEEEAQRFEQLRLMADGEREAVRQDLAQMAEEAVEVPEGATLDGLRQRRDEAEANLAAARERLAAVEAERDQRARRRAEIPAQLAAAGTGLEDVRQALAAAPPAGQAAELTRAQGVERRAKQWELERQIEALRRELANYDARVELMPLRLERASRRIAVREAALRGWRAEVDRRLTQEAERQALEARRAAALAHPLLREVAETNVELAERRRELLAKIQQYEEWGRKVEAGLLELAPLYEEDRRRLGLATEAGLADLRLRARRDELPEVGVLTGGERPIRREISRLQRERFNREYEMRRLPAVEAGRDARLAKLPSDTEDSLREELRVELEARLTEQRSLYGELIGTFEEAERELIRVASALDPLLALNREYRRVIDERVLWVRSMDPVHFRDFGRGLDLLWDLLDPGEWRTLLGVAWNNLRDDPLPGIVTLMALVVWMTRRRRIRDRMTLLAERVSKWTTDRYSYTVEVAGYSLLNALFWPAVLWWLAWRAGNAIEAGGFAQHVASGLLHAGAVLLLFGLVFQVIRQSGLARSHFRWREDTRTILRRHLLWVQPLLVPLTFVVAASDGLSVRTGESVLARGAFMAGMVVVAVFVARVLRPEEGILRHMVADSRGRWLERLQYVWYPMAVAVPLTLAVLAGLGFFYTARQLEGRFLLTVGMAISLVVVKEMALRWLFIAKRKLAIEEARKRREAAKEEARDATPGTPGEAGTIAVEDVKVDLGAINVQTRKVVRTLIGFGFILGIWLVWSQMLPALGMLDRLVVWPKFEVRESVVTTQPIEAIIGKDWASRIPPPFQDPARPFDQSDISQLAGPDPAAEAGVITVKNVILCLIIAMLIGVVSRNIPGLLEIMVLQKLPLEPSGRYAIVTLTRYGILVIGTILTFGAIGIGWSQVQWLVAAITLGIGFGLQEIVANFISGIIILFEQPIRVGDTVTVGKTSGQVAKIRMRATTIVDWDRKELIIPNKAFITGEVVNWTLSDPVLRLVIPVGIAYGSDTRKAEEILLRVAREDPAVMEDPAPSVVFNEFGDSALNFILRVFLPHISELVRARHELHTKIDQAFREAGIEIAFPQRDIHIRSVAGQAVAVPVTGGGSRVHPPVEGI